MICTVCLTQPAGIIIDPTTGICAACQKKINKRRRAYLAQKAKDQIARDHGLTKVRGALGGTYYE